MYANDPHLAGVLCLLLAVWYVSCLIMSAPRAARQHQQNQESRNNISHFSHFSLFLLARALAEQTSFPLALFLVGGSSRERETVVMGTTKRPLQFLNHCT